MVAMKGIAKAAVATRRNRISALVGITALLLPQSLFKVSSRGPERKKRLPVLVLGGCEQRLFLQQVAKQNRLLCVCVSLVAKFLLFCIPDAFGHGELRSCFTQLSELRIYIQENLIARISLAERRLAFRHALRGDIVALLVPVPRLPGKERSYGDDILREKGNARRSQVVSLNRDVGQVSSLLNLGLQTRLFLLDGGHLDLWTLCERTLPSCIQIHLFWQSDGHRLDRKLDQKISAQQPIQRLLPVRESVFDDQ